jgi:hypothetical protein
MFHYHHLVFIHSGSSTFLEAFSAELIAGLVILIVGSFAVPRYLDWRRKPHLTIINPATRNSTFYLTKAGDGFWEATLELVIKNQTAFSQREWFWHIMIPTKLNPQFESLDQTITCQNNDIATNGQTWRHYFGNATTKEVIFPKRTLRFNYRIKIKTSEKEASKYQIHYYFNTEFGTSPSKADQIESIITNPDTDKSIVFNSEYLASINLEPEAD